MSVFPRRHPQLETAMLATEYQPPGPSLAMYADLCSGCNWVKHSRGPSDEAHRSRRRALRGDTGLITESSTASPAQLSVAGSDTRETDTLNEGVVLDSTAGPPLVTSSSPRTVVGAHWLAVLKMVTTIRFHGELS